jgi:hypothetical protein
MSDNGEGEGEKKDGVFDNLVQVTGGSEVIAARDATQAQLAADKLRLRVLKLRDQMGEAYFEMGRLLHRINKEGIYTHWQGPDGRPYQHFRDYVEHEVDFQFRKAKHLMSIWWWFAEELGDKVVMEKIKEIGWTKAAMLVGVVDGKNVDIWVGKARQLGVKELGDETRIAMEAAARGKRPARPTTETSQKGNSSGDGASSGGDGADGGAKASGGGLPAPLPADPATESRQGVDPLSDDEARDHRSRWTVLLSGEQRINVERAIDRASELAEVEADGKGFLVDLVATGFLTMHAGTVGNNDREHKINFRNELLRSVERALGVDIVAVDRTNNTPLFGMKTIDRMAAMEEARDAG